MEAQTDSGISPKSQSVAFFSTLDHTSLLLSDPRSLIRQLVSLTRVLHVFSVKKLLSKLLVDSNSENQKCNVFVLKWNLKKKSRYTPSFHAAAAVPIYLLSYAKSSLAVLHNQNKMKPNSYRPKLVFLQVAEMQASKSKVFNLCDQLCLLLSTDILKFVQRKPLIQEMDFFFLAHVVHARGSD